MGVIVHKEQERNAELSRKITADLRIKAEQTARANDPDLVENSDYLQNLQKTSKYGWFWFVLVGLAMLALILIIVI